jgi:hypothetical protein
MTVSSVPLYRRLRLRVAFSKQFQPFTMKVLNINVVITLEYDTHLL